MQYAKKQLVEPEDINVLLIEDTLEDGVAITQGLFESDLFYYFRIIRGYTLKDALHQLDTGTFNVVLLDLGLPDAKGLKAVREVHQSHPDIPIVIISGYSSIDVIHDALENGAQEFLVKGESSPAAIRQSIYQAIARKKIELSYGTGEKL